MPHAAEAKSQGIGVLTDLPPSGSTPQAREQRGLLRVWPAPKVWSVQPAVPQSDRFDLGPTCCRSVSPDREAKAEFGVHDVGQGPTPGGQACGALAE